MANCAETSKSWRKFLNEEGIYPGILQKDMIISYTKCSRGYLQKVLQTTSLETLAFEVRYLFKRMHYHGVEKELKYLKQSAKLGYLGVYQLLSERLEDKNPYVEEYFFHETNLHEAAGQGHLSICQFIMKHTVDKNPASISGWTPLHFAARSGHLEVYRFIMNQVEGKNPWTSANGLTPLHQAAEYGHLDVCKLIVEIVDNKNPWSRYHTTPLEIAEKRGHFEICSLITSAIGKYFLRTKRLKVYK